ncbi:hypothetical protein [Winogradskyella sp. 4-2091]|uniref:hypothetical protein n=1 Tax=Winogradskyella sp. 4-2091 TaxID=3381659 RepID=UPI003891B023
MKQIDYIKIKVNNVDTLNTTYLVEHPTIKNRYHFNFPKNGFNGRPLFGKNIEIYHNNSTLYLKCSLPYLVYGHNHIEFNAIEAKDVLVYISSLLNVNLLLGIVVDFEVGYIYSSTLPFKELCHTISGIQGMDLQKKTNSFLAYGHKNKQFKLYNIYANLKRKVSKSVFNSIENLSPNNVKLELKFTKDHRYSVCEFLDIGYQLAFNELDDLLQHHIQQVSHIYNGVKFDDILYMTLLKANKYTHKNVDEMVLDTIATIDATPSQKSARRLALRQKQAQIKHNQNQSFIQYFKEPSYMDLHF